MKEFDIVVIGGGPAGLAAAISANNCGKKVLLIEREGKLGGILKQCIHDGFGVIKFNEKLSGPEYALKEIDRLNQTATEVLLLTFVTKIKKANGKINITYVNKDGVNTVVCSKLILSTGCRERTSKQIGIHGSNPSGVFSAGSAQYYINIMGKMPTKKCVILGSGDIGLIMARRLTLEGAIVEGVYEAKNAPSGLTRNIVQCLNDFNIPLYLSHSVTRVFGEDRVTAVEISKVDENMTPIKGTERIVVCDALILSVGLIPENEVATSLNIQLDSRTKGPICDQNFMTDSENVYVCGNAMHVNDLADYVSESGTLAGEFASKENTTVRKFIKVESDNNFLYVVPQLVNLNSNLNDIVFFFRSKAEVENKILNVYADNKIVLTKNYQHLRPPEMERIVLDFSKSEKFSTIHFVLEDKKND